MTFMDIEELKQELVRIESSIKTITGGRLKHSVLRLNGVILLYLREQSFGFRLKLGIVFLYRPTPYKRILVGYRFYLRAVDILYLQ